MKVDIPLKQRNQTKANLWSFQISLSISLSIYIYVCVCVCVCVIKEVYGFYKIPYGANGRSNVAVLLNSAQYQW